MKETGEILFDASRFKLTARKSDSKLNGQSFSVNTQKGGISMEVTGDGMPTDNNNDKSAEQEASVVPPTPPVKTPTQQLFSTLDNILNPQNQPMTREIQDLIASGEPQAAREVKNAVAQISLEEQNKASLEDPTVYIPQEKDTAKLIIKNIDTGEIGILRDLTSSGQLLNMVEQANPKVDKQRLAQALSELGGVGDEAVYKHKLKDVLVRAVSEKGELPVEDSVERREEEDASEGEAVDTSAKKNTEARPQKTIESEYPAIAEIIGRVKSGRNSLRDEVFLHTFEDIDAMNAKFLEETLRRDGDAIVRRLAKDTGNEDRYLESFQKLLSESPDIKGDFKKFMEVMATDTGSNEYGLSPEEEADPVVVFKVQLLGKLGAMIRAKAGDMNEKIRYEQRIAELVGLEGDEFLQRHAEVMQEIFGEENPTIPEDLVVEVDTEEIARESAMDEFTARDQIFEKLFDDLEDANPQDVEALLRAGGEAIVRLLSDGTGHEDQYVELLEQMLEESTDIKGDLMDFLAMVRADAATIDSNADRDKDNEDVEDEDEDDDIEVDTSGGEGRDGSGGEPPTTNEFGDGEEDDYENSEEYKKMEAKWLDYRLKEFAFNNKRKPTDEERAKLLNENDKKFILAGSPPPLEIATKSDKQRGNEWLEKIRAGFNQIDDIDFFRKSLKEIMYPRIAGLVDQQYAGENTTFKKKLDEIFHADNLDFAKDELNTYLSEIKSHFAHSAEKEEREKKPESFEDLLELIMRKETDEYKTGGIRELIDENGAIRPENFAAWARKKGRFWSNFNPDSSVDLYREISVPLYYSPLTFNEMVTNPQFFRRREVNPVADEDGNPVIDPRTGEILYNNTYHEDKRYEKIKDKIMNDIFYYNQSRNYNIAYIETMEQDDKLGGTVAAIMQKNVFTKKGFETFFSLPGTASTDFTQEVDTAGRENFLVGEGAALATSIYNSISDIEELRTILGDDSTFLKKEYRVDDSEELTAEIEDLGIDGKEPKLKYDSKKGAGEANVAGVGEIKWSEDWFDADGNLKKDEFSEGRFADYINIFNEQKKDQRIIDEVRHRVRQSIMEKILPKMETDEGIVARARKNAEKRIRARQDDLRTKKIYSEDATRQEEILQQEISLETQKQITQFAYEDALHSEEIVYTSLRWTGVAANNDTTATGFDAGTKFFQTAAYRIRQGAESRGGGAVGNIKNIMIYKRLVAPFLMGIKTVNNKTPLELAREITLNMGKKDASEAREFAGNLTKQLEFVSNTMKDYGANHYNRGGQVFEGLAGASELDLGKIVQFDLHKGMVVNKGALISEVCEKILKPERYRTSTYNGTDYAKFFRFLEANKIKIEEREVVDPVTGLVVIDPDTGKPKTLKYRVLNYEKKSLGEAMYGEQVFDDEYRIKNSRDLEIARREAKPDDPVPQMGDVFIYKVQKNRGDLWKEGVSVRLASELASHVDHHDPVEHWPLVKIETFFAGLGMIPADIEVDEKNFWNNHAHKKFFNDKLQRKMRKKSRTERWRLYGTAIGISGGGGFLTGLMEMFSAMVKEATR